jgi:cardiolipin synthase A/B
MELAGSPDPRPTPAPVQGGDRVAVIDQPAHGAPVDDPLVRCLVHAARHARERIDLAFGYLILLPALRKALLEAHRRGVAVRILTNSAASVDYPFWVGASAASLDVLVQAGVPVYRMRSRCLHSKCAVLDGRLSTVGSHNLWTLSTLQDAETNLLLDSPEVAGELTRLIDERLAEAVRVDPAASPVPDDRATRLANRLLWAFEPSP